MECKFVYGSVVGNSRRLEIIWMLLVKVWLSNLWFVYIMVYCEGSFLRYRMIFKIYRYVK